MIDTNTQAKIRQKQEDLQDRARHEKHLAEERRQNAMTFSELSLQLQQNCKILENAASLEIIEAKLMEQVLTLNAGFITAMHDAGLGRKAYLGTGAFKTGLLAQKLCRETYTALLKGQKIQKSYNQTKET